ncbi:Glutaredoxin-1 [Opisthocomus hoazin]|uniref:Glutaredoxin-1 n=1 Tax=Opisthocomus hoazin TaxID=30419 RepID=A0A091XED9_OPIHO|nr:Glutaredoxin-1 [Opisthocomus hoazin]
MAESFVQRRLRKGRVTLFKKAGCPYCGNAVEILKQHSFAHKCLKVVDITQSEDVQEYLQQETGRSTVPYVFSEKRCIGGLADLQSMRSDRPGILQQIGALR